jgi:hypothetical protein
MFGYVAIQVSAVVLLGFSILSIEMTALRAAKHLHAHMLKALLKAPLRFAIKSILYNFQDLVSIKNPNPRRGTLNGKLVIAKEHSH